ncbi:MAG: tetratricopeptide repeat protein [Gemmataceae bacterium]
MARFVPAAAAINGMTTPMRKLNTTLLLGLFLGTVVCTGAVFGVHQFQYGRIADSLLWQARRAEEQGQVRRQARYLQRYLEFNRKDLKEKARLAKLWIGEEFADSPRERGKAVRMLDDVLAQGDDQPELRRLLVKAALEVNQYKMARNHLEKLLTRDFLNDPPEPGGAPPSSPPAPGGEEGGAERGEIFGYAGQLLEAENQPEKALPCYRLAKRNAPHIESNYLNLAQLLRKQDRLDSRQNKANQREADQTIDELVKNNPLSAEAYLTRWRYRRDFGLITLRGAKDGSNPGDQVTLKEAATDVEAALQRAPELVETLLGAADLERLEAQAALFGSGSMREKEKERRLHRDKALEYVSQGLKLHQKRGRNAAVDLPRFRLLWHKANLLLDDLERLDQQRGDGDDSGSKSEQRQAWMTEAGLAIEQARRTRGSPAAVDFLKARLLLLDRRWAESVTLFEQARPALGGQAELAGQINRYLGQCYEQLAEPGQMFKAFERLRDNEPNSLAAQLGMAQAEWMLHHFDKAAEIFQRLAEARQLPPKSWLDFARLEMERQIQKGQLNWIDYQIVLRNAEKFNPDAVEVPLLKAQWQMLQGNLTEARRLLTEAQAEKVWKNSGELWSARISMELRDKSGDRLTRSRQLLTEAKKQLGERVVLLRLAEARLLAEENGPDAEEAINRLAADLDAFKKETDQAQLLSGLADAQLILKKERSARALWQRVAKLPSRRGDLTLQMLLFDLSRKLEDETGVREALESIRAVEGNRGPFHRLGEALRLIWRAEKADESEKQDFLEEARDHLDRAQSLRPEWPPVYTTRAQVESMAGRKDQERFNLHKAIELGETNPAVIREYIELLLRNSPDDEATQREAARVLKTVSEPLLVSSDLWRLAATLAAHNKDIRRAQELMAKNRPEKDARDFRALMWEGLLLAETNNPEAEKKLRAALETAQREPEPYVVLVQYLVRQKREKDAETVLELARRQLPPTQVELTLGRCYEILGHKKSAQARYEEALNGNRRDAAVVRRVAGFYWNASKIAEAEPLLRDIVEKRVKDPAAEDVNWARWHLALVLANGTDYGRFREALDLVGLKLDNNGQLVRDAERERTDSSDNRRFQARVLASQAAHRQFRQRAREQLEEMERSNALPPDDRFILAMLHESENEWAKAKPILAELANQKEPAPRHLAYYVQTLIEHKEIREVAKALDRLETLEEQRGSEPNAFAAVELRARLLEEQNGGDKAIRILEDHIKRKKANPNEVLLVINSMRRQKKFILAYQRCLQAWKEGQCSSEVVGGASVAVLRGMQADGAPASHEQVLTIEKHLNKALESNPKSVVLMLHLAELYDQRGRWDDAESMYRRVLQPENEPKNIVALNNLAWLLAQRSSDPDKHQEALTRIEAAVAGIGRRADLLDTRGLVHLKLGHDAAALADFRAAAADMPSPTHLFHLARAHYKASDKTNASKTLKLAQEQGLQASLLHPSEQREYQKLLMELKIR